MNKRSIVVAAVVAFAHTASGGSLVPNPKHVDHHPAAVTGRSGNATASVSALLDKQGNTTLVVQAGRLGVPAGTITKIQLKAFKATEQVAWTRNFNGLSGSLQRLSLPGFRRGQPIQTETHIKGIDGNRTDIVTTSGIVKLLPDLQVLRIDAPVHVLPGDPIVITAAIAERNGDTGGQATCVLRVDGVEVDRAAGIWVDASATVDCAFTYAFPSAGTKQVAVALEAVTPSDYDLTNNTRSVTVGVAGLEWGGPFNWFVLANNVHTGSKQFAEGWYEAADHSFGADWSYSIDNDVRGETAALSGTKTVPIEFPISMRVTGIADGQLVSDLDIRDQPATDSYDDGEMAIQSLTYSAADGTSFWISTYRFGGDTWTDVQINRSAAVFTFFSSGYMRQWYDYHGTEYFFEYPGLETFGDGQFWPMTSTYQGTWSITSSNGQTLSAAASLVLEPILDEFHLPLTCGALEPGFVTGYECRSQDDFLTGYGKAIAGSTP